MRTYLRLALFGLAMAIAGTSAYAANSRDAAKRLEDFRKFFVDFQYAPDKSVPGELLAQCHGLIVMREYKAGFVFGVRGGDGVVFLHNPDTGEWSPPAFVVSAEGSFGFQIGGQAIDGIVLIMNRSGVDMLLKTRFKVGVDASAAAGPVGRDASAKVGPGTALLAYSRAKGLYAGAAFEGGAMLNNNKYNRALYGRDIGLREILFDRMVSMPAEAVPMVNTLANYAAVQGGAAIAARKEYQSSQPQQISQPMVQPEPVYIEPAATPVMSELEPLTIPAPEPPASPGAVGNG